MCHCGSTKQSLTHSSCLFPRLLVAHRPLWLLDEPTSALDTASQATLLGLMETHRARGGLIVATTHAPLALAGAKEVRIERSRPAPSEAVA